jgi:glycosyltransferase involved in cell wall biosynthesis
MRPTISVIMPVYNVESYVAESITSILNQTFSNFEFIVINDGSTDNTPGIILSFHDPRIVFINNSVNRKKIVCLNEGLKIAKGDFFTLMDGDDVADSTRLEKLYYFFQNNEEIGVCGTWFESFGDYSHIHKFPLNHDEIYFGLFNGCPITFPLIKKSILDKNNINFDPDFFSEDSYLWIRLADLTRLANIPEVLYKYRVHSTQVTQNFKKMLYESVVREKNIHFNNLYRKITFTENESGIEFEPTHFVNFKDLKNYESQCIQLFNENSKKKIFSQNILQETLSKQFYRQLSHQVGYNLRSMVIFYLSPLRKHVQLTLRQQIIFILKSIMHKRIKIDSKILTNCVS